MRRVSYLASTVIPVLLLSYPEARGQVLDSQGLYCNSGLHADSYIDFSALPAAPAGKSDPSIPSESASAPVTAILPVSGAPGLTATISIPALRVQAGVRAYTVNGTELQLNGLPVSNTPLVTLLTLSFNHEVNGVGLNVGNPGGRYSYSYNLQVGDGTASDAAAFSNTASGFTLEPYNPRSQNLQLVGLTTTFSKAAIQFVGESNEGLGSPIISNIRVRSGSAPDAGDSIPKKGLEQWLRADKGASFYPSIGTWEDQSGNGHDATPTPGHAPRYTVDGRMCQAAWQFDGSSSFSFNLPISGWSEMTVFLVARSTNDPPTGNASSTAAAILWSENASSGNIFVSPYQKHVYANFGDTRANASLSYIRPNAGIGGDFTVTRAVHDNGTDSLYVNGLEVLSEAGNHSTLGGTSGAGVIGEGAHGTHYDGEISEILIYDRVLSVEEAAQVESYLRNKYGIE